MFILDSLFLSGFRWVLNTVATAADAEMNDDTALREELLAAEMRREMGEISDGEFAEIESDLLARIREIKSRHGGGSGPIVFGRDESDGEGTALAVEATIEGEYHEGSGSSGGAGRSEGSGSSGSSGMVMEGTLVDSRSIEPEPRTARTTRTTRTKRTTRTATPRTPRTPHK